MKKLTQLSHKILLNHNEATLISSDKQGEGKTVVFTNGCFDILHRGHVNYLAQAADLGDILIVGLNTDQSVKRQGKGDDRPINSEDARLELLSALFFVDFVVLFDGDTPIDLIEAIQPNVLVKGGDYDPGEGDENAKTYIVGREIVLSKGGSVKTIDLVKGYSTTNIANKLAKSQG